MTHNAIMTILTIEITKSPLQLFQIWDFPDVPIQLFLCPSYDIADLLNGLAEARRHLLFEFQALIGVLVWELGTRPSDPGSAAPECVQWRRGVCCCTAVEGLVVEEGEGTEGCWGIYESTWYIGLSERLLSWGVAVRSIGHVQMKSGRPYSDSMVLGWGTTGKNSVGVGAEHEPIA
ncbi:hypothetical protein K474DRAFT_1694406 [Panus rudis PR-1116 ss-1]|nr:hypothetical protein K474DRAFT_1694406 [Panus rudis PR-1116 ss-1]